MCDQSWLCAPAPTLLPDVTMMVLEPGVNGVRTLDEGEAPEAAYKQAVWRAQEHGWVYLSPLEQVPAECLPAGVPSGSYLRELPCEDPRTRRRGKRYLEAWNVPADTLPDEEQEFEFDVAAYERWLLWLVQSGQIKPVARQVAARLLRVAEGHLERAYTVPNLSPEVREQRIKAKKAMVERYTEAGQNRAEELDLAALEARAEAEEDAEAAKATKPARRGRPRK